MIEKIVKKNTIQFIDEENNKIYHEIKSEKTIKTTINYYDLLELFIDYRKKIYFIFLESYKFIKIILSTYLLIKYFSQDIDKMLYYYILGTLFISTINLLSFILMINMFKNLDTSNINNYYFRFISIYSFIIFMNLAYNIYTVYLVFYISIKDNSEDQLYISALIVTCIEIFFLILNVSVNIVTNLQFKFCINISKYIPSFLRNDMNQLNNKIEEAYQKNIRIINRNILIKTFKLENNESNDDSCSICLNNYKKEELVSVLNCNHKFHTECIKKWFDNKTNCPYCRKDIDSFGVAI